MKMNGNENQENLYLVLVIGFTIAYSLTSQLIRNILILIFAWTAGLCVRVL